MEKVVVVEGRHDYVRIKQVYPDLPVLITNGSAVTDEFLNQIKKLSINHEIILLLDPDYPGEKIRKTIAAHCENVSHAFVKREYAISKNGKKVGIEHTDLYVLKEVLNNITKTDYHDNITFQDLYDLGLIAGAESKKKRIKICDKFNIGYANGKQLVHRLNLFNITLNQVKEVLCSEI